MTAASAPRRNRVIDGFRDWACLETFPLTAWACGEWLHSIDRGDHDHINTPAEIDHARRVLERLHAVREAIEAERPDDPEAVIHTTLLNPAARTITETWRLFDTEYSAPWGGPGFVAFEVTTRHGKRTYTSTGRRVLTGSYPDVTPDADAHPLRITAPVLRHSDRALSVAHRGAVGSFYVQHALWWARGIRH